MDVQDSTPSVTEGMKVCPFCRAEVPTTASRCRYCTSDFSRPVDGPDLSGFWIGGVVITLVGVAILGASDGGDGTFWGALIAGAGGVLLQIAVVASAVSIGMRHRDGRMHETRYGNRKLLSETEPAS